MDLYERQLGLEKDQAARGQAQYLKSVQDARTNDREATTDAGHALLNRFVDPLADAITTCIDKDTRRVGRTGRPSHALPYMKQVEAPVLAWLAVSAVLDTLTKSKPLLSTALVIASRLEDEVRFRMYAGEKGALYTTLVQDLKRRTAHPAYQRRLIINRMGKAGLAWEAWPKADKVHIGVLLIDLLIQSTGCVSVVSHREGKKKTRKYLRADPELLEWVERVYTHCSLLSPQYVPMVVEPENWTTPFDGGYLTKFQTATLLRTRNTDYLEELKNTPMPEVYAAVNRIQSVPWRIHTEVLDVMTAAWDAGSGLGGLPSRTDFPEPPRVGFTREQDPAEMDKETFLLFRDWKSLTAQVHRVNHANGGRRLAAAAKLYLATQFKDDVAIYFPHTLDWRGRIYPLPGSLTPQADDLGRGLLRFAKGKPIGPSGAAWLAIHGANLWGEDKVDFRQRMDWVLAHEEEIVRSAQDPLGHTWWADADSPWQFLGFCFEWRGFMAEGEAWVSYAPCSLDGSNNGLQHFACLMRDPETAHLVNVTASAQPQDIYQVVADAVQKRVDADAKAGDKNAQAWCGLIDRKLCKRPTMTSSYGATRFGYKGQVMEDTIVPILATNPADSPFDGSGHMAALYLAGVLYEEIGNVAPAARQAMGWLQKVAQIMAKEGLPIWWETPCGLPVLQEYRTSRTLKIQTRITNTRVELVYRDYLLGPINSAAMARGVSPNFVHSLDASHLMLSTNLFWDQTDNPSFAAIHDSYATHACDLEELGVCLRVSMRGMYRPDLLADFRRQLQAQLPEDADPLPPSPEGMGLDLEKLLAAYFVFS